MRIVIDLQGAQTESRFRGIGRYSLSIALGLARNAGPHEIWLALNASFPESIDDIRQAFAGLVAPERIVSYAVPTPVAEHLPANAARARAAEQVRAHFIAALRPDAVLMTSLFEGWVDDAVTAIEPVPGTLNAAILYDLIPHANPDVYLPGELARQYYQRKIDSLKAADLLLAISSFSRSEAIDALGIAPDKVVSISTAVDARFTVRSDAPLAGAALLARLGITRKVLMYAPGGFDQRKNFDGLITAYAQLPAHLRGAYQLVIASRIQEGDRSALVEAGRGAGLADEELVLTGYLSDDDLVMLYNLADLFVFPSKHEGFGLPVLEAMACGAPTIGSNTTSVPEVIGCEEALFDPAAPEAIAAKIAQVMEDDAMRARLRAHGVRQAATFSWDRSALAALAALEARVGAGAGPASWPQQRAAAERDYRALIARVLRASGWRAPQDGAQLRQLATAIAANMEQTDALLRRRTLPQRLTWRIEGPFDSTYSLALLNRETALAMHELGHQVVLHSTEGPGDFKPDPAFLRAQPQIAALHARAAGIGQDQADVSSRNLYPPRVADMSARLGLLHHYAWEETGFPQDWVDAFNAHLQGMTCLSQHVQKVMVDNGVTLPMTTSGCGVDHWDRIDADPDYRASGRAFRFLHVSSCFPRKGADVLLKAYGQAFTSDDDVTLIIKTFANPHNEVHEWLAQARRGNARYPDVQIIEKDLSDAQLKALFGQCHALVAPSRAEGFGMPLAEAMLTGLPVITTGWSGQLDFCNPDTAWLIDYTFAPADTHFGLFGSMWAEPNQQHLADTMRQVFQLPAAERRLKADNGRALLMSQFRWSHVAQRLIDAARGFAHMTPPVAPRVGWITTWNTKCGIATYSQHLIDKIPAPVAILAPYAAPEVRIDADADHVLRCWESGEGDPLDSLAAHIDRAGLNTLVVQFNYGFFNFAKLSAFLLNQVALGRKVVLMVHATIDPANAPHKKLAELAPALRACQRVLVHALGDLNRLKAVGVIENVAIFPHGVLDWPDPAPAARGPRFTIASYGFFLPHKGLPQLVEAVALLAGAGRDVHLKMVNAEYPIPESAALVAQVRQQIAALGMEGRITLDTGFLDDQDSLGQLSGADLIVFPYQDTGESASGAVRYGLATGRPVAVTPLAIFSDVNRAVFRLPGQTPAELAGGIGQLIDDISAGAPRIEAKRAQADLWRQAHRYSKLGQRLFNILRALNTAPATDRKSDEN